MKTIKLMPVYVKLSIKRLIEYKTSFYTFLLNQILTIVIWLTFWNVLLSQTGALGSWDFKKMIILTAFSSISNGIWFFLVSIWRFPNHVLSGDFSVDLVRPVNPLTHFIFSRMAITNVGIVFMGGVILLYGMRSFQFDFIRLVLAISLSLLSVPLTYIPFVWVVLSTFWLGRSSFLRDLVSELFIFENYPLSEFPSGFFYSFIFVFPLAFTATIPTLALTEWSYLTSLKFFFLGLIIVYVQVIIMKFIFKRGLRKYESFGG